MPLSSEGPEKCVTADCAGMATKLVALVDMDGEAFPYCENCAADLVQGGDRIAGPFDPVTDEMVERAARAMQVAESYEQSWGDYLDLAKGALAAAFGSR